MAAKDEHVYRYSNRPPYSQPVYTVQTGYEPKTMKREYSTSTESSSSDTITVEDPPDRGQWAGLVILGCTILHVCNELVYFIFYNSIVIANLRSRNNATAVDAYTEFMVFEDVRLGGEIVAAVFSVYVGYRVVAMFGSLCVIAGFLAASFITPSKEIELMGFLVGFIAGIGCSFWRFTAYVAIMEYFKKHRMAALILSGYGRVVGIFIGYGILSRPFAQIRDSKILVAEINDMMSWQNFYRCQIVMAGVAFFASILIKPLALIKGRGDWAWILRVHNISVCRPGMLILLLWVYLLYYLGESLPSTTLLYWMDRDGYSTNHILGALFALACGVLLGYILMAFWPGKKKLYDTFLWMGILCLLIGLLTLQLPVFSTPYISYVCAYTIILAAAQVMFELLIRYVIPIGFGRQYIRWIEGLLGIVACGATVANNFIAKALQDLGPGYIKNIFYFAGSAFLAAGVFSIIIIQLAMLTKFKDRNLESKQPKHHHDNVSYSTGRPGLMAYWQDPSPPKYYYGQQY